MDTGAKIDPELQLSLSIDEVDREKSVELNVGYEEEFNEWELIVKYVGDIEGVVSKLGALATPLFNGYAIVRIRENLINALATFPEVLYIEKPKTLILEEMEGIRDSCVERVRLPDYNLTGRGTIVAILDSGIDISHPDFRNDDGTTRILKIWDQGIPGNPPQGFFEGTEYTEEDINKMLLSGEQVGTVDTSGHGTAVAGIACGNGRASNGRNVGVAPNSNIIVVKLRRARAGRFFNTIELMTGLDYVVKNAIAENMPVAINLSFGNNYGDHNGSSIVESYIDSISNDYKISIAIGTGNEGITGRHASGTLVNGKEQEIEFIVAPYEQAINLQIWKTFADDFDVSLVTPNNIRIGPISKYSHISQYRAAGTIIDAIYADPSPYNSKQEIYISLIPTNDYIFSGIWKIVLTPRNIVNGEYNIWLPVSSSTSPGTFFQIPSENLTLTIPSSARNVISVGAYNSILNTYASFSGRGSNSIGDIKPTIVAPGVGINAPSIGGGYSNRTGTSFATPFVAGAAALLMEWGIVNGNDPYMYGEKVKAYLIRGARQLPGMETPNYMTGYGRLCVSDSLPE